MEKANADEVRDLVERHFRLGWTMDRFVLAQVARSERELVSAVRL